MATKKYATGFTLAASANLTDQIQVVQSGVDKQQTHQQLLTLFQQQTAFQPNGGERSHNFNSDGTTLPLTNPAATLIKLTNTGAFVAQIVRLPAMNAANSWKAGTTVIKIFNGTASDVSIHALSGSTLYTLPAGFLLVIDVESNATSDGTFTFEKFGSASAANISNTAYTTVAGVSGSTTGGITQFTVDADGSISDTGISPSQVMLNVNNLSDVTAPNEANANINAMKNGGFESLDLTLGTIVLTNPAKTWLDLSDNDGVSGVQLPPPPAVETPSTLAWQPGQVIRFDNHGGSNSVPLYDYLGALITTFLAASVYDIVITNDNGGVGFVKIA
jgi:hypothetical protein